MDKSDFTFSELIKLKYLCKTDILKDSDDSVENNQLYQKLSFKIEQYRSDLIGSNNSERAIQEFKEYAELEVIAKKRLSLELSFQQVCQEIFKEIKD